MHTLPMDALQHNTPEQLTHTGPKHRMERPARDATTTIIVQAQQQHYIQITSISYVPCCFGKKFHPWVLDTKLGTRQGYCRRGCPLYRIATRRPSPAPRNHRHEGKRHRCPSPPHRSGPCSPRVRWLESVVESLCSGVSCTIQQQ